MDGVGGGGVFISYRRDDSAGHAGRLFDALTARFGERRVFMDVDSIDLGVDFVEAITAAIGGSSVVLALIGPEWLDARDDRGSRRLDDPDDYVRRELELAFGTGAHVVPVLIRRAAVPDETDLPPSLARLARCNAFELSDRLWNESSRVLVDALVRYIDSEPESSHRGTHPSSDVPAYTTTFIGRQDAIAAAGDALAAHRLVTLTGPGGVGKTRLAFAVAARMVDGFADGTWVVELAPLRDGSFVADTIASALGIAGVAGTPTIDLLVGRIANRRLLLVVDNCEHILEAAAQVVGLLQRGCPQLHVIATSREPLGVIGEVVRRVTPLSVPSERSVSARDVLECDACALFVARAQLARADFAFDDATAATVAEICRRLDGLPLAIELAAARLRSLSLAQIGHRLDNVFRLLGRGAPDGEEHHGALRATIAWSYDLLNADEQGLVDRLSVFAGGCDVAAAEAVCAGADSDPDDLVDLLASLVDKSMLLANENAGDVRYEQLETIRAFAAEQLAARGDGDEIRRRHVTWVLAMAGAGLPRSAREQVSWLDRLDREHDNVRAALAWAFAADPAAGARLAVALHRFWDIRGHFSDAEQWLTAALAVDGTAQPVRAELLRGAGNIAHSSGRHLEALRLHEQSAEVARSCGDQEKLCFALNNAGLLHSMMGDFDVARARFAEMTDEARGLPDESALNASARTVLADIAWQQGRFAEAAALLADARRDDTDQRVYYAAVPDYPEALLAARVGDLDRAWALLDGARDDIRRVAEPTWNAEAIAELATIATAQARFDTARELIDEGRRLIDGLPLPTHQAHLLHASAVLDRQTGALDRALRSALEALEIRHRLVLKVRVAETLELVAGLLVDRGDATTATTLFGATDALRARLGAPIYPSSRASYDDDVGHCEQMLGREAFATVWNDGHLLDLDQAVATALAAHTTVP